MKAANCYSSLCLGLAVTFCLATRPATGDTFTLNPSVDEYAKALEPDAAHDGDYVSVYSPNAAGGQRDGLLQFDLSGVTGVITSAYLELNLSNLNYFETADWSAVATLLGSPISSTTTWTQYQAMTQVSLQSLGTWATMANPGALGYYPSSLASSADLAALNAAVTSPGYVAIALKSTSTGDQRVDWADTEHGFAPLLVITTAAAVATPEPGSVVLLGVGIVALATARFRRYLPSRRVR